MSDEKVLADLRAIRQRLAELEEKQGEQRTALGLPMLAVAVAAATFALTTATWYVEDGDGASTLWSLGSGGWFPMLALPLVVIMCVTTIVGFSIEPASRVGHFVQVGLSIVTAGWVLFIGVGVPEDANSAPARWLTIFGMLIIAWAHGKRAGELRYSSAGSRR